MTAPASLTRRYSSGVADARRDLERAVRLAPQAGLFRIDAAEAAHADGDDQSARDHLQKAEELLGDSFEEIRAARNSS